MIQEAKKLNQEAKASSLTQDNYQIATPLFQQSCYALISTKMPRPHFKEVATPLFYTEKPLRLFQDNYQAVRHLFQQRLPASLFFYKE